MGKPARVLLVGEDSDENSLEHDLRLCGLDCFPVSLSGRPADAIEPVRPDVVVLNLLSQLGREHPSRYLEFARALKALPSGQRTPIMMVGERRHEHTDCALDAAASSDVDDIMLRPVSSMQIATRLRALTRLKTMHEELVRRLTTTARYGVDAPISPPSPGNVTDAEALVVGASVEHGKFESALSDIATLVGAISHDTALDYLQRKRFDIVIVDCNADTVAEALDFCGRCRADARLYNTPIVILAPTNAVTVSSPAFASGVTDLLEKPVEPEELKVRVMALVREVRFRDSMRRVYREFRHIAAGDALTGLYTRGFALEHMKSLIEAAQMTGSVFSAAFGRIINMHEINTLYGFAVGDRVIRQVGELIGLLMRGEDLSVRYGGSTFAMLLPDTDKSAAAVAVSRVRGVVNHTEFAIPEISIPIPVVFATHVEQFANDPGPETFIKRIAGQAVL